MRMMYDQSAIRPTSVLNESSISWLSSENPWDAELFCTSVLPEQFFAPPMTRHAGAPELGLMRAVMEDAVRCFLKQLVPGSRRNQRLAQEATTWFFDDDTTWPYSFLNLCTALEIDPGYVRRRLQLCLQTPPPVVLQSKLRVVPSQRRTKLAA